MGLNTPRGNRAWLPGALVLAAAVLFYFINRPAYRGYFSDDDLATMTWAPNVGLGIYSLDLISPKFSDLNVRPVGLLYYRFLGRTFQLRYAPYVLVVQMVHVLNVLLLFLLLRQLEFPAIAAGAAVVFYAFTATVMEAYWKPMFVFDLLCATLCLLTLLLYIRGRWFLALFTFWLAYKSKEIAVMLPLALFAYEFLLGKRRWMRLIPYFAISLSFGLQALLHNSAISLGSTYVLHFSPAAALTAARYYSSAILLMPDLWVALLLLPLVVRDRRLYVGAVLMVAVFVPLALLPPEHALAVYWYVPTIGFAIAIAAIASRMPRWAVAAIVLLWLPCNYVLLRDKRRDILAEGDRTRSLLGGLRDYARKIPPVYAVVYNNTPPDVHSWGVDGAIKQVFGPGVEAAWSEGPYAKEAMARVPMAVISFDARGVRGMIRNYDGPQDYARFSEIVQESQFGAGWYDRGEPLRWIGPRAEAFFYRPEDAHGFEILATVPRESLERDGPATVTVFEDGRSMGTETLSKPDFQWLGWTLTRAAPGEKHITIVCKPVRHGGPEDPRDLGIAIWEIGYDSGPIH